MPGRLFEVRAADPRAALAALHTLAATHALRGLLAVHLYGDIVRVLIETDDAGSITSALEAAGIGADVQPSAVDMETAFAFLAELATTP